MYERSRPFSRFRSDMIEELSQPRYSQKSLYEAKYVAEHVQISMRMENLSWTHHSLVAPLPSRDQKKWLKKAEKSG